MSTTAKPKWYCDEHPERGRACAELPCKGHRVTKDVQLAAEAWAWADGYDWHGRWKVPQDRRQDYLNGAGDFINRRAKP